VDDLYTLLGRVPTSSVVLDLGCGRGSFAYETCPGRIIAMDLALPDKTERRDAILYMRGDSSAIPLRDSSVDAVVSHHTLEHFLDYRATLAEIRRILSPQGWLWIAVPNGYGFDDALYRFIFAGGGHVNRFQYNELVREVEAVTQTRLQRSCDLFSSFIYLKRPTAEEVQHYPSRAGFLREIPKGFLTFFVLALNVVTRWLDKSFGTRYSQYGWGFVFARHQMTVSEMPSYFNVCRQCGSGNSMESIARSARVMFGLGRYHCPHCGEINVWVSPPRNLQ
jgi:SAM-dependent methyltransferase